ncbi:MULTISPECIES: hypothetical protein [Acidobacteriaceae]|uniref:hypothetical protein n=1 Tax=Acidobacteriaceae TaxID=204434 RepID=UPI00131E5088|nr:MULTISPECIES: hypothetical protein [Acidobacteriaceae]MDW5265826.1 hypothetical protein [Edaphobacter sp.]
MVNKYLVAAFALLAAASIPAHADSVNLLVDDASGVLGYVNVDTGAVTLLGNSGVGLTDIAFSPTGSLYGVDFSNLYSINTTTGHASEIGSLGDVSNALVFSSSGTLYSAGNNLDTVDPATGHATIIGSLTETSAGDLAFVGGQLYLATSSNQLAILNAATGAETIVGNTGVANLFGLASPDGKTLYGVAGTDVYLIDTSTGAATFLTNYGGHGLGQANGESFLSEAQTPPPSAVTPEPSTWVLLASGLLFLVMIARSNTVTKMTTKTVS